MGKMMKPSIMQVLDDYNLDYKYVGNNVFTYCLWHPDSGTPNLCIYPDTGSYYCFACKCSGTVENLIAKLENKSYYEVCKMLYGSNYEFRKLGEPIKKLEPNSWFMRETLSTELRKSIQNKEISIERVPHIISEIISSNISMEKFKDILEEIRNEKTGN